MAKYANWNVVIRFGIPAALSVLVDDVPLQILDQIPEIGSYSLANQYLISQLLKQWSDF